MVLEDDGSARVSAFGGGVRHLPMPLDIWRISKFKKANVPKLTFFYSSVLKTTAINRNPLKVSGYYMYHLL
jgi:hypothetical protein